MDMMGIINLNESENHLQEITQNRPLAALPFAGRYRLIDFVLSNMVNSGITNVGVLIRHKSRSLMDHLRSGKEWDLARKRDGLVLLPPAYSNYPGQQHRGDIENFYTNLDYIQQSRQKYVLITGANVVCNLNFEEALQRHKETGADVTALYAGRECTDRDCVDSVMLEVVEDGRVTDIQAGAASIAGRKLSLGMFLMEKKLLLDLIDDSTAHGEYDFVKHCLIKNLGKLKFYGYRHDGYMARIYSTQSYFQHNLELLNTEVWQELFGCTGLIYTKVKDEAPAKYTETAKVKNSLIANGCFIEGTVENSVLFRGVKIKKGAHVRNSIIIQKSEIGEGAVLENVICDKDVHITEGRQLKGEASYPLVIKKGRVI